MTLLLWFSVACVKPRDPAPEDLEGLIRYLYTNWEDPVSVEDGMNNMVAWLETEGRTEIAQNDGYILEALDAETIGDLEYPTRIPLSEMAGAAISWSSPYPMDRHAEIITEADQKWNAPSKYDKYDRTITEGSRGAFLDIEAHSVPEFIFTHNDIEQERLGIRIPYILLKNYRWTTTTNGKRALLARSWIPHYGCSSDDGEGGNCVELSFSVDMLYESSPSETLRLTASWNYLSLIIDIPYDIQIDQLANGIIGTMEATDEYLAGE